MPLGLITPIIAAAINRMKFRVKIKASPAPAIKSAPPMARRRSAARRPNEGSTSCAPS